MCDADKQATLEASPRAFCVHSRFGVLSCPPTRSGVSDIFGCLQAADQAISAAQSLQQGAATSAPVGGQ